jgi:hypothetical protein
MRFLHCATDQSRVVNGRKVTDVRKVQGKQLTDQAGVFAALEHLYAENSEALRRLADCLGASLAASGVG